MKLGGLKFSRLTVEFIAERDECWVFPLLLNELARAVAFIAFASYGHRFIKAR